MKTEKEKHCGNCSYHDVYHYPDKIFCVYRYLKGENPIVDTLWHCENWTPESQPCFCVQDAKNNAKNIQENPKHSSTA